jgi:predicted TIM-barrel fold metal-dependent hydrolase
VTVTSLHGIYRSFAGTRDVGVARTLFAVDWPFQPNGEAVEFIKAAELDPGEREQIFGASARRLLRI